MGILKKHNKFIKKQEEQLSKEESKEEQDKNNLFLAEYKALVVKHKRDIAAVLSVTPRGIVPIMRIVKTEPKVEEPIKG